MGIGKRIKQAREQLNITQKELGRLIGVTGSAITNYENEVSHPKEPIMYKLLEVLKVDANYLFQDEMKTSENSDKTILKPDEHPVIAKYRHLNDSGKEYIVSQLDYALSQEKYKLKSSITVGQEAPSQEEEYVDIAYAAYGGDSGTVTIPKKQFEEALKALETYDYRTEE